MLERNLRHENASLECIARERQDKGLAIMDGIEAMFAPVAKQCTPSDPLGKAIGYANKMWNRLKRYALDGRYLIDNNQVERM